MVSVLVAGLVGVSAEFSAEIGELFVAEIMEEYLKYLRQMANLPRIYGLRFYSELERIRGGLDD